MVQGGTGFRKAGNKRFKKKRGPTRKSSVSSPTDESMEVETINVTAVNNRVVEDGDIPGSSTALPTVPISEKKLAGTTQKMYETSDVDREKPSPTGYRFIDMGVLANVFSLVACPRCGHSLTLTETKKQGMSFELNAVCNSEEGCQWKHTFWTSKKKNKCRSFDVNRRSVYAMRRIGNGHEGLKRFLMLMNHPPPMHEKTYRKIGYKIYDGVKDVAECLMQEACDEVRSQSAGYTVKEDDSVVVDTGVTLDGTWQKRGFTSYNGAVMAISIDTGKILDLEVMSRYCQYCVNIEVHKKDDISLYEKLKSDHICSINHDGSAPKMEQVGVERIFGRSIEKNKVRYTEYYGDGDTKSFASVENVYGEKLVVKKECIGHVQKRVGTRLRKLKKTEKGLGKLGLNDAVIDKLQNYYGIAIRNNIGSLAEMKTAIYAAWCHVASSKNNNFHEHCPDGPKSWCMFKVDQANGTCLYVPGMGLRNGVIKYVKAVFNDLSNDSLLMKCLHGKTQNQNESFNGMIWNRVPKAYFIKYKQFAAAIFDAAAHFNRGNLATLMIYDKLNIERGYYTTKGCIAGNTARIKNARRKNSVEFQGRRKFLRGEKKRKMVKRKKTEGKVYGPGIAD